MEKLRFIGILAYPKNRIRNIDYVLCKEFIHKEIVIDCHLYFIFKN